VTTLHMSPLQNCADVAPLLDTFADGELSAELTLAIEQHLNHCAHCNTVVERASSLKKHLRAAVYDQSAVSPEFMARIQGTLATEARALDTQERLKRLGIHPSSTLSWGPLSWRTILPFVAAACALLWVNMKRTQVPTVATGPAKVHEASAMDPAALDEVLDELIDYHSTPPVSQLTEPALVPALERDVGVRVHLPSFEGSRWAANKEPNSLGVPQWQSASVVPVHNQRAAYLRYKVGAHWVTLYVYNSGRFPVHRKLEQRVVRDLPVYVGERRGYSIAARERKGIGYAVATDFSDSDSAELVAAIH